MEEVDSFHLNFARSLFGVSSVCSLLGIFFNSIIFLTTIRSKSLRATYNILIALCAVADIFHLVGTLNQAPFIVNFHLTITIDLCDLIMFLPEMGISIGCMCILCVGVDRMISVIFSLRYRSMNKRVYHIFLSSLILGYCAYICALMIIFYEPRQVFCEVMAPYGDGGVFWFTGSHLVLNISSAVVYSILWLFLRNHQDSKQMNRIIRSLFIIVAVDLGGWFLTPGLIHMAHHILHLDGQQMLVWRYFSIIFINLALSVKFFIYYSTSSEYRSALRIFINRTNKTSITENPRITSF